MATATDHSIDPNLGIAPTPGMATAAAGAGLRDFWKLALRDAGILAAAGAAWWWAAPLTTGTGPVADFLGLVVGVGLGVGILLLHEWGHLAGALATGSHVRAAASLSSRYLFSFDSKRNTRSQFLVMSVGGFLVTGAAVAVTYGLLPDGALASRVARGAALFGVFLMVVIEFPLVAWALLRPTLPPIEVLAEHRREVRGRS
ncbi:MAG: hypothetical protein MJE66_21345 [Proteobacteria bacterium]|nr:hypothetical protein [Pseudomonadota bacterium]